MAAVSSKIRDFLSLYNRIGVRNKFGDRKRRSFLAVCIMATVFTWMVIQMRRVPYRYPDRVLKIIPLKLKAQKLLQEAYPEVVADWIISYGRPHRLVILDPVRLECMLQSSRTACVRARKSKDYRFALIPANDTYNSMEVMSEMISDAAINEWQVKTEALAGTFLSLVHSKCTINLAQLEQRTNYWYIHGAHANETGHDAPRAFMNLNLTQLLFSDRNETNLFAPHPLNYFLWQWPRSRFLECNRTSAAYLRQKHPYMYWKAPVIKDWIVDSLAYYRDFLHRFGIAVMLQDGTSLGWYRECGIIPHTKDMDLSFLSAEWKPAMLEALKTDTVLSLYRVIGKPEDLLEITVDASGVSIDLFALYNERNRTYVGGVDIGKRTKLKFWYPPYEGACTADLKGHLFHVRCDILRVLQTSYGPLWYEHHHTGDYKWAQSPPNVEDVGQYNNSEWPSAIQIF